MIGIIDADLITRKKHRFPNLASMKISGYCKAQGHDTRLITSYEEDLAAYEKIYISKVFTNTEIPEDVLRLETVTCGGTGFYFNKAPAPPPEIEHPRPDYSLYDGFVEKLRAAGSKPSELKSYTDYSIGYLTRKCFRGCKFCVNQDYKAVEAASPLEEFLEQDRKKICLLDDNFLGFRGWEPLLDQLIQTEKPFKFMQGLDERLLTPKKIEKLFSAKYDGEMTFAFDDIADAKLIEEKLDMIRKYSNREIKFYILSGYNPKNDQSAEFWKNNLVSVFERMNILAKYKALPYIMRHEDYERSPYKGIYITIGRWANQPGFYRNISLNQFIDKATAAGEKAPGKYREKTLGDFPELEKYFSKVYEKEVQLIG